MGVCEFLFIDFSFCVFWLLSWSWVLLKAQADVILIIDITNPALVTFTATGAFAENDDIDDTYLSEGFTLMSFFRPEVSFDEEYFDTSTLDSPGGNFSYTVLFPTGILSPQVDLNIAGSGFSTQDFTTTAPAFTGFATVDLRHWMPYIAGGTTGNILAGDALYNTEIIGQFQVVPEPGVVWLFVVAALFLIFRRRARFARS